MRSCLSAVAPTTDSSAGEALWPRCVCAWWAQAVSERQGRKGRKGTHLVTGRVERRRAVRRAQAQRIHQRRVCVTGSAGGHQLARPRGAGPASHHAVRPGARAARTQHERDSAVHCYSCICALHATCEGRGVVGNCTRKTPLVPPPQSPFAARAPARHGDHHDCVDAPCCSGHAGGEAHAGEPGCAAAPNGAPLPSRLWPLRVAQSPLAATVHVRVCVGRRHGCVGVWAVSSRPVTRPHPIF